MRARAALVVASLMLSLVAGTVAAQVPAEAPRSAPELTFGAYLAAVARANLTLAAQRANVSVADAQITIARVFPDPVLTAGVGSWEVSGVGAQNSATAGVSVPVEWPTKRPARIAAARAGRDVAAADLEDVARTLRGAATAAWIDAIFAQRTAERRRTTAESMERLAEANAQRVRDGALGEMVALQTRIEAARYRGEALTADGEVRATRAALDELMGARGATADTAVHGELRVEPRTFTLEALVAYAAEHRADLRARREGVRAARARVDLAQANRGIDVSANLGWQYSTPGQQGSAFEAPGFHSLGATLSVPLPLSRIYDGEVRAARASEEQSLLLRDAADLRATTEIREALARYDAARARLGTFDASLLADNDRVLEMARYAFEHGASRLLELLLAQRTWAETTLAYEAALADHARALAALETAAALWDLAF